VFNPENTQAGASWLGTFATTTRRGIPAPMGQGYPAFF